MRRLLLAIVFGGSAWAAAIVVSGGIVVPLGLTVLRARAPERPLALVFVALLAYAVFFRETFSRELRRGQDFLESRATLLAAAGAIALAGYAVWYGTFTAGGADSYGYVNQAYQWYHRELPQPVPLSLALPFSASDMIQTPLGYRLGPCRAAAPSSRPHRLSCAFMMAVSLLAGACGPYLVTPFFAAVLVWATFALGRRTGGPLVGLLAAGIILTSPVVLFQSVAPMSDIAAAALWTASLAAALVRARRSAWTTGLLTALGLSGRTCSRSWSCRSARILFSQR